MLESILEKTTSDKNATELHRRIAKMKYFLDDKSFGPARLTKIIKALETQIKKLSHTPSNTLNDYKYLEKYIPLLKLGSCAYYECMHATIF